MSPEAAAAAARRIEELELDLLRCRHAYALLSGYVGHQVDAALRRDELPSKVKRRVAGRIKDRIRRDW